MLVQTSKKEQLWVFTGNLSHGNAVPGTADGWQQEFSGLLGVKRVFKSRAKVEHEEEQSTAGKEENTSPAEQHWSVAGSASHNPCYSRECCEGEKTAVIAVQRGFPTNQGSKHSLLGACGALVPAGAWFLRLHLLLF